MHSKSSVILQKISYISAKILRNTWKKSDNLTKAIIIMVIIMPIALFGAFEVHQEYLSMRSLNDYIANKNNDLTKTMIKVQRNGIKYKHNK